MKTSELKDLALDWAVAKCEGVQVTLSKTGYLIFIDPAVYSGPMGRGFNPSTDWAQAGPIIEDGGIATSQYDDYPNWSATMYATDFNEHIVAHGPTLLIAAMRCYVASKLGDDVDVPEELT